MFECERNSPSEKSRVIYDASIDCFFQMQESSQETSMFIERAVMKETKVFTLTQLDPIFFLLQALEKETLQHKNDQVYQSLE
jgi:hypothetical protein